MLSIRRFKKEDAKVVSDLIVKTLLITNAVDYGREYMQEYCENMTVEKVLECDRDTHFYVAVEDGKIVGCAGIGLNTQNTEVSELHKLFIDPEYQGRGIGKNILSVLEKDEYALNSKKITGTSSITAVDFYEKMGYGYKEGTKTLDEVGLCYNIVKYV
mgnify:CR=1 FL=1